MGPGMFQKKTVFVVGAGASREFGMPTGDDLKGDIVNLLSQQSAVKNGEPYTEFRAVLMNAVGPEWHHLQAPGFGLAAALPSFVSIDEAIHYFGADDKAVRIGKLAIAFMLLKYERGSSAARSDRTGLADPSRCVETWLAELLSMALSFAKRETVKDAFANIYFINFNYDRVIEQYLYAALQSIAGLPQDEAAAIVANLNVIRPYGSLGPLPVRGREGIEFGFEPYQAGGKIQEIASGIRTYTEQMDDDPQARHRISQLMTEGELVIFIGFGFHQQNVALLRASGRYKPVFATAYKIDEDNYSLFSQNLQNVFGDNVRLFNKTGYELLSKLRPTISAAAAADVE
jgi:hypothetical protein